MESIFNPDGNKNLIERIEKLTPITLSEWGVMTVSQMLEHCQQPIKVSRGELHLKQNLFSILFGKMIKKQLMRPQPFKQGLPTVKQFKISHEPDFEQSKKELLEMIDDFVRNGHSAIKVDKHPFFGKMSMEEWDTLHWKHLDHHLKQFGV